MAKPKRLGVVKTSIKRPPVVKLADSLWGAYKAFAECLQVAVKVKKGKL